MTCVRCQWGQCQSCEGERLEERCCCGKRLYKEPVSAFEVTGTLALGIAEMATSGLRLPLPDRLAELKAMPYREYLQTPEWKARRKERLAVQREMCEWCGFNTRRGPDRTSGLPFNVHHLTYERRGMEAWDDLVLLCTPCHKKAHGLDKHGAPVDAEAV